MYETLTEEQLALVTPAEPLQGMSFTNSCHYWVSGTRMQVYLLDFYIESAYGESIRISIGEEAHDSGCCAFYDAYSNLPSHMVPEELRECLFHPIYYIEELTLDMVRDRAEIGSETQKMLFSVKFGDVVVLINSRGVTLEWIYQQLVQIRDNLE